MPVTSEFLDRRHNNEKGLERSNASGACTFFLHLEWRRREQMGQNGAAGQSGAAAVRIGCADRRLALARAVPEIQRAHVERARPQSTEA
jgi:hypothetical protein